jgi:hypothetical protein
MPPNWRKCSGLFPYGRRCTNGTVVAAIARERFADMLYKCGKLRVKMESCYPIQRFLCEKPFGKWDFSVK